MKETILFGRLGNKQQDIQYFKQYLPINVKTIVEPFGGTFAVTRIFYNDDKYKKIVNDTDEQIFEIYKNPEKYNKLKVKLNDIALNNKNEKGQVDFIKFNKAVDTDKTIMKDSMFNYWIKERVIRGYNIKTLKNPDSSEMVKIMKKINFKNDDYLKVINKFKTNKDTFIFIDPPYLFSDNGQYASQADKEGQDMTDMIIHLLNIMNDTKTKAKIMLIINDLKIIRMLYGKLVKGSYEKIYQMSKKKDKHLIIMNYDNI
jgi:site-specific DNA-adenine methylase